MTLLALVDGRHLEVVIAKILEGLVEYLMGVKNFVFRPSLKILPAKSDFSSLAPGN